MRLRAVSRAVSLFHENREKQREISERASVTVSVTLSVACEWWGAMPQAASIACVGRRMTGERVPFKIPYEQPRSFLYEGTTPKLLYVRGNNGNWSYQYDNLTSCIQIGRTIYKAVAYMVVHFRSGKLRTWVDCRIYLGRGMCMSVPVSNRGWGSGCPVKTCNILNPKNYTSCQQKVKWNLNSPRTYLFL